MPIRTCPATTSPATGRWPAARRWCAAAGRPSARRRGRCSRRWSGADASATLNPVEARARRAVAAVGLAAVVIAAIGVFYLRPWVGLVPASRPSPRPTRPLPAAPLLQEQFLSATLGWVVTGDPSAASLFRTTDGGRHWQHELDGASSRGWTISFFDSRRGLVTGADARGPAIWRTVDGGQRWTRREMPCQPPPMLISFADPDHGWCVVPGAA